MNGDLFGRVAHAVEPPDGDKGRDERGAFFTPQRLADGICQSLAFWLDLSPRTILEPGCGGGAFLRAAAETWPAAALLGVDLVPACVGPGIVQKRDLFDVKGQYDLIVGNPDFGQAEEIVRHCVGQLAPGGVLALLLLADFEGSASRIRFWQTHPLFARQGIGDARASFRADKQTDMRPYAVFVWRQGYRGAEYRGLPPLFWKGDA